MLHPKQRVLQAELRRRLRDRIHGELERRVQNHVQRLGQLGQKLLGTSSRLRRGISVRRGDLRQQKRLYQYLMAFGLSRHRAWLVDKRARGCWWGSRGWPIWGSWETSGARLGVVLGPLGASLSLLGAYLGPLGAPWGHLEGSSEPLAASCGLLRASWRGPKATILVRGVKKVASRG